MQFEQAAGQQTVRPKTTGFRKLAGSPGRDKQTRNYFDKFTARKGTAVKRYILLTEIPFLYRYFIKKLLHMYNFYFPLDH